MAIRRGSSALAEGRPPKPVFYPERDGKPMGETDLHRDEINRLISTLQTLFAGRNDVYVSGDLLFYYVEGDPRRNVCPDVMLVYGVPNHRRRIYKLWEEGRAPSLVIEVTSRSTRRADRERKPAIYASLGIEEYYLYDPWHEYLFPPLQGFRLRDGVYLPMESSPDGSFVSAALGTSLRLVDGMLRLIDPITGEHLPDRTEAEARERAAQTARAEAEARERAAQTARAEAAERRVAELEALLRQREQQQ